MNSLALHSSVSQPYQKEEFLQIDSTSSPHVLRVVKDAKGQTLPEVLKELPRAGIC